MPFTCCEEFYIAEHLVERNSSEWMLIIKMDGSKVQTRFQLFIFRLFIQLLMNDIRSNIQPHVPIHLSTAVIIDGHSNIHSYVSIYLHVISRVSLNLYIYLFLLRRKLRRNCLSLCPHLSSYFGSEIYNVRFVDCNTLRQKDLNIFAKYIVLKQQRKGFKINITIHVTPVYEYIK